MKLTIGNYVITSDSNQFILNEERKSDPNHHLAKKGEEGKTRMVPIGYYCKLDQLCRGIINHGIRNSEATSLIELNELVEHLAQRFDFLFSDAIQALGGEDVRGD